MFREMRRKKQQLAQEETAGLLQRCSSGVLSVAGDDGYPYAVPLSYAMQGDRLYFHCAKQGHKLDAILRNEKVSFCVIEQDDVVAKEFTTHYRSAVVFGRARILSENAEKQHAFECLVEKYSPGYIEEGRAEIARTWDAACLVEIKIECMTGKAAKELTAGL